MNFNSPRVSTTYCIALKGLYPKQQIRFMNMAVDKFDSKNAIAQPKPVCANNNEEVVVLTILLYVNVF